MDRQEQDPFDGVVFDDAFVEGASRTEPSAERRAEEARLDEALLRIHPSVAYRRRRHVPWGPVVAIVGVALLALAAIRPGGQEVRSSWGGGADHFVLDGEVGRYPSPPSDVSDEPLALAPIVAESDAYGFVLEHDGEPVRWDPCRPIHLVVSGGDRVPSSDDLLRESIAEVSRATGLVFEIEGTTTEVAGTEREPVQDRYGDRWAPVLVAWTDPEAVPRLAGDVAGLGGAQPIGRPGGSTEVYVTGAVYLDAPTFVTMLGSAGGYEAARGIVIHELGHLVGLAHVDDPTQLMYESTSGRSTLGLGDRAGLARLGDGPCVPDL